MFSLRTNTLLSSWNLEGIRWTYTWSNTITIYARKALITSTNSINWAWVGRTWAYSIYPDKRWWADTRFRRWTPGLIGFTSYTISIEQKCWSFTVASPCLWIVDWICRTSNTLFVFQVEIVVTVAFISIPETIRWAFDTASGANPDMTCNADTLSSSQNLTFTAFWSR